MRQWWKLFAAAERNDSRWHGSVIHSIAEVLSHSEILPEQKIFMLRAWRLLVDGGALARMLGTHSVWMENVQDPSLPYAAYRPELSDQIEAGALAVVYEEAYQDACAELATVRADAATAGNLDTELLDIMRKYGWNVERKNAPAVLQIIMHRLRAFDTVARDLSRYLLDPEAWVIESAMVRPSYSPAEDDDCD